MHGLEDLIAGRVAPGVYRWRIDPEELFRTVRKAQAAAPTRTAEGRLALPLVMGGGHADLEMPPWLIRAEDAGWEVFGLGPADSKDAFLAQAGEVLEFPDYYNAHSWDAFYDLLTDMEWLPAERGYLVVWPGWPDLAERDADAFTTALDVFGDAVDAWAESDTPMYVLLPGEGKPPVPDAVAELPPLDG
ncbi:barstar family protein [Actinocorallia sp. API 0066]|uniref:barstar family protein n=1 Tax=Actinocorallia sp. API 0066 TaxID=2896846 RepID=UPI001E419812|nr:barstar family protein [Actinocorallia sp. API 0066]MCD0453216.1 barstar family protein [Actinocorallia sp. API 0066]